MRKVLVIAVALVAASALSACGNKKGKSKIAAAKATGNTGVIMDATKSALKDQAALVKELEDKYGYYGMTKFGVSGALNRAAQSTKETFKSRSVEDNQKILGILHEINNTGKEAAKGGKGITPQMAAEGADFADRSAKCIDDIQKDLKKAQEKEAKAKAEAEEAKKNGSDPQPNLGSPL